MSDADEVLTLDFDIETRVVPRKQHIMNRPIKKVMVEFEDGEILEHDLNHEQGFYRETLTYEEAIDRSRVQNMLRIYNVFWTVKEPM